MRDSCEPRGSRRCSVIQRSIFVMTSRQECISCIRSSRLMNASCSFRCPFRRNLLCDK